LNQVLEFFLVAHKSNVLLPDLSFVGGCRNTPQIGFAVRQKR
jgi:hypothetical protein